MPSKKFALVIPTLNEAGNILTILDAVKVSLTPTGPYEVIVVDDNSSDGTADLVTHYSARERWVRVLVRKNARGLAGAILYGWEHTDADWLGAMDADLQHPPELLPKLLAAMQNGADIAIASRYLQGNGTRGWNPARRLISSAGTWITVPLQRHKIRVKDPLSGFFIVRRSGIEGIELQRQGFKLLLEILVRGRIRHAVEVPFHFGVRHAGKSKASLRVALNYFSLLGRLSVDTILKSDPQ